MSSDHQGLVSVFSVSVETDGDESSLEMAKNIQKGDNARHVKQLLSATPNIHVDDGGLLPCGS